MGTCALQQLWMEHSILLQEGHKQRGAAYPVHASTPSAPPAQVVQRQEYMRHALQMDSASY